MKPTSAFLITVFIFALLAGPVSAKDRHWQTGKVLDQENDKYVTSGSSKTTGKVEDDGSFHASSSQSSTLHRTRTFAIECGDLIYIVSKETTGRAGRGGLLPVPNLTDVLQGGHEVKLTINGPVKFAIEKDKFYLLGDDGREHSMKVEKKILKEAGRDAAPAQGAPSPDQTALITIDSGSPGSEIELDGTFMGNTPAKLRVAAGPHRIAVKSGRQIWQKDIQVVGGSAVTLKADFGDAGAGASPAESTQGVSSDRHPTESDTQPGKRIEGNTAYIQCSESASAVPFSSSARSRKTLKCGEKVTILDRSGNWVRIRTADNVEGHVSSRLVGEMKPATVQ